MECFDGFMLDKEDSTLKLTLTRSKIETLFLRIKKRISSMLNLEAMRQTALAVVEEEAPTPKKKVRPKKWRGKGVKIRSFASNFSKDPKDKGKLSSSSKTRSQSNVDYSCPTYLPHITKTKRLMRRRVLMM